MPRGRHGAMYVTRLMIDMDHKRCGRVMRILVNGQSSNSTAGLQR